MRTLVKRASLVTLALVLFGVTTAVAAQGRAGPRSPGPPPRTAPHGPVVRGQFVFIGGYFYDPFFGPYPWWMRRAYPYPYLPVYDQRANVRLQVTPRAAEVHVDGFYAGIVDDFDGFFQGLPLPPGGHTIEVYLDGYRTFRRSLYLTPGSRLTLRETLERLPEGSRSEPPLMAPPLPAPPEGTFRPPVTVRRTPPPSPSAPPTVDPDSFGTLQIVIQPVGARVTVDGAEWLSSDGGRFVIEVPEGPHQVEVAQPGYQTFSRSVEVRAGEATALNISLTRP